VSNGALDVLRSLNATSDYVFPGKDGKQRKDFRGPWQRIRKEAGLPNDLRLHGMRHNFGSTLISNGADLAIVKEPLHHRDIKTNQRYAHLKPDVVKATALRSEELLTPRTRNEKVLSIVK
jgi:site-specific recombinase XerD